MLKRIIVSIILIPAIIYIIYAQFLNSLLLFLFVMFLCVLASKELYNLLKRIYGFDSPKLCKALLFYLPGPAVVSSAYIKTFFYVGPFFILYVSGAIFCVVLISSFIYRFAGKVGTSFLVFIGSFIYTGICPLVIFLIRREAVGISLVYVLFLLGWLNDTSAYFIGSFFGRTKGIIKFSPNKSLEGYTGSFVLTLVLGVALKFIFRDRFPFTMAQALVVSFVVALLAPSGDLLESLIKRKAGVKDSSHFLPGLGGVLDIFDSIFMSAPFYYILLKIF